MRHPSFAHEFERRPLFEAAKSQAEIQALERQWRAEDEAEIAATAQAADWRTQELRALRVQVDAIDKFLTTADDTGLIETLRLVIRDIKQDVRSEIEQRNLMSYKGVWDEAAEYQPGSFVTVGGAGWVAVGPIEKGERPGKAAGWKLAVKSPQSKEPAIA
jgi:hypothetical protein